MQNVGVCFRQFKYDLEKLKCPPIEYSHIEQEHWDAFVSFRLKEEFQSSVVIFREKSEKYVYNYRMSRKGYTNLSEELVQKKSLPNEDLTKRCVLWKRAPMDREGNIPDKQTQEVVDCIWQHIYE